MIEVENTRRIIGDFFEINADILQEELSSKYPKFISKWIANRKRNKLINIANKFRSSNHKLDAYNLIEYISYIQNNYSDTKRYKSVFLAKVSEDLRIAEAMIKFDNYKVLISVSLDLKVFDVTIDHNVEGTYKKYDIHCDKLDRDGEIGLILYKVNDILLKDISDFIIENISAYKK